MGEGGGTRVGVRAGAHRADPESGGSALVRLLCRESCALSSVSSMIRPCSVSIRNIFGWLQPPLLDDFRLGDRQQPTSEAITRCRRR